MEHGISAQAAVHFQNDLEAKETLIRRHAILESYKDLKTVLRNLAEQLRLLLALNLLLYFLLSLKHHFLTLIWYKSGPAF